MAASLSNCGTFKQRVIWRDVDAAVCVDGVPGGFAAAAGHRVYYAKSTRRAVVLFDANKNTLRLVFSTPREERFEIQLIWIESDKLLVYGLRQEDERGLFRYFDVIRNEWVSWDPGGEELGPRWCPNGVLHERTLQYVVFGGTIAKNKVNELFLVNHERNWVYTPKAKGRPPSPRSRHGMCTSRDKVFVYGGRGVDILNDLHCLHVKQNTFEWSEIKLKGSAPQRYFHAVAYLPSRIFVYGGGLPKGICCDTVFFIDLDNQEVVDINDNAAGVVCETVVGESPRPWSFRPQIILLGSDMLLLGDQPEGYAKIIPSS